MFMWSLFNLFTLVWVFDPCYGQINRPPEFVPGGDMSNFHISEDTPIGTIIYKLGGKDPDGQKVFYYISGDAFSVDKDSGLVKLIKQLDRERESNLDVIITIIDEKLGNRGPNTVSVQREIKISDANDNSPHFIATPYSFSVSESTKPFTTIFEHVFVKDEDIGYNSQVTVECHRKATPLACDFFHIQTAQIAEGEFRSSISLKGHQLDYEIMPKFMMTLIAVDNGGLNSTTDISIQVADVQDEPPKFLNAPYSITVNESTPAGTGVMSIMVRDGDATFSSRRRIKLEIVADPKKYFNLVFQGDDTWSLLTSNTLIDREDPEILLDGGVYRIGLRAAELIGDVLEGDVSYANVTIVIHDINDQIPHFNLKSIDLIISEDIANGSAVPGLNLIVSDSDTGDNAKFNLTIEDMDGHNKASDIFSISPTLAIGRTPVLIKVTNSDLLDYEDKNQRHFKFNIVASQGTIKTSSEIKLSLSDANDNQPIFENSQYSLQVPENIAGGSTVLQLKAIDFDSGDFGKIRYSLRGFGAEKFLVDENSGDIRVASCNSKSHPIEYDLEKTIISESCLDYESQPSYSLTYEARDGGGKHTSVNLFLEIQDVNDNPPKFLKDTFIREVYENERSITPQLLLKATDLDGPSQGGNSAIRYYIVKSNLTGLIVDSVTGEVKLTRPVEANSIRNKKTGLRNKLHYEAIVKAVDGGNPSLESEARIEFHVKSERDGAPIFMNEPYIVSVKENASPGTAIIQVRATDPDGPDSAIKYSIINGGKDNFIIDEDSGIIRVSQEADLDIDAYGTSHFLTIAAKDDGSPLPLTSTTNMSIVIEDVNNKSPIFEMQNYFVYLPNNQMVPGTDIITIRATDPDKDAKVRFAFDEENIIARDETGSIVTEAEVQLKKLFRIESQTGVVKVNSRIDTLKASVVIIPVAAMDINAYEMDSHPQKSVVELTIYIQTHNDKNPVFAPPWTPLNPIYEIRLPEETLVGSTIMTLAAKNPVTNKAITEFEKIKSTDPDNYFSVSPLSGIITLNKRIDFEEITVKQLKFSVRASSGIRGHHILDGISPSPHSIANILVNIQDINDNSPVFSSDLYSASILESARWPQTIISVEAQDKDSDEYGEVSYEISGEKSDLFEINNKTGIIGIKNGQHLDREENEQIHIQVTAKDNPNASNQRRTSVLVKITIIDVNDNVPVFEKPVYHSIIPENVAIGYVVGSVKAIDFDANQNGEISYEVIGLEDFNERDKLFNINETSGHLIVSRSLSGKGRPDPYELSIRAYDHGTPQLSSEAKFFITIGDISSNDGVPRFIKPEKNEIVYITENVKPGSFVYQIEAVDADSSSSPNGQILYKFLEHSNYFELDSVSGVITTSSKKNSKYQLDREKQENFTLILVAFDLGVHSQESHRLLFIHVNDTDDNEPYFDRLEDAKPILFEVEEEVPINSKVAQVTAIDLDSSEHGTIYYEIINGNEKDLFTIESINNVGQVKSIKRLDREKYEDFILTIKASSTNETNTIDSFKRPKKLIYSNQNKQLIQIQIKLIDLNDNKPNFEKDNYFVGISLKTDLNTPLVTIKAVDPDVTPTAISYLIKDVTYVKDDHSKSNYSHVFELDRVTGVLKNEIVLRQFLGGYFNLRIVAISSDEGNVNLNVDEIQIDKHSIASVNVKIYILQDGELLKFVFHKKPNDVKKNLDQFKHRLEEGLTSRNLSINFYSTQYYERRDGSLDFESTASCFQMIKLMTNQVMNENEAIKYLKNDQTFKQLYENFSVVSIEQCDDGRVDHLISNSEMGIIIVALVMAIITIIFIFIAQNMKKNLKKKMGSLGIFSGFNEHDNIYGSLRSKSFAHPASITKSPSFIHITNLNNQRIFEWQERDQQMDAVSFRSFPTLR